MKKLLFVLAAMSFAVVMPAVAQEHDWANFERYEEANAEAGEVRVVFMGDSITEGWVYASSEFFTDNNYAGRGISGQVTSQMLVRFRPDVIDLNPECVVILAGTNDIALNNGRITLEHIMDNIISMVELAKYNDIEVILCSVLPAYDYAWKQGLEPAEKIVELNKMIKSYAAEQGIAYVDFHKALKDKRNGLPAKYADDGVHPNKDAYGIMEKMVKKAIDEVLK